MSWEIKKPSSTKEIIEIWIFRFFNVFSRIWKTDKRYNADKIGERAKPCLTSISVSKRGEEKLFQKYFVFLPTK